MIYKHKKNGQHIKAIKFTDDTFGNEIDVKTFIAEYPSYDCFYSYGRFFISHPDYCFILTQYKYLYVHPYTGRLASYDGSSFEADYEPA